MSVNLKSDAEISMSPNIKFSKQKVSLTTTPVTRYNEIDSFRNTNKDNENNFKLVSKEKQRKGILEDFDFILQSPKKKS